MGLFSGSPRTLNVSGIGYPREPANIRRTRAHARRNILFTYVSVCSALSIYHENNGLVTMTSFFTASEGIPKEY